MAIDSLEVLLGDISLEKIRFLFLFLTSLALKRASRALATAVVVRSDEISNAVLELSLHYHAGRNQPVTRFDVMALARHLHLFLFLSIILLPRTLKLETAL